MIFTVAILQTSPNGSQDTNDSQDTNYSPK